MQNALNLGRLELRSRRIQSEFGGFGFRECRTEETYKGPRTQIFRFHGPNTIHILVFLAPKPHHLGPWTLSQLVHRTSESFAKEDAKGLHLFAKDM